MGNAKSIVDLAFDPDVVTLGRELEDRFVHWGRRGREKTLALRIVEGLALSLRTTDGHVFAWEFPTGRCAGDGLIEIRTLAQLDAMRHDINGNGVPADSVAVVRRR